MSGLDTLQVFVSSVTMKQLKIATYNVENLFIPPKGNEDDDLSSALYLEHTKPQTKVLQLSEIIKKLDADIIGLSELGGPGSLKRFNSDYLESAYIPECVRGNSDRGIDVGFLIRKGLEIDYKFISHKDQGIGFLYAQQQYDNVMAKKKGRPRVHPDNKFSRDLIELQLFRNGESQPFMVLLQVHLKSKLDSKKIDHLGHQRRAAEAKTLGEFYQRQQRKFPNSQILMMGDFNGNLWPGEEGLEFSSFIRLINHQDILEILNLHHGDRTTCSYFDKRGHAYYDQLDYIFIPKDIKDNVDKENSGVFHDTDEIITREMDFPSDHFPVFVTLNI